MLCVNFGGTGNKKNDTEGNLEIINEIDRSDAVMGGEGRKEGRKGGREGKGEKRRDGGEVSVERGRCGRGVRG